MQWEISLSLALLWILTQLWIFCLFFVGQSTCNSSYPPSREYSDYPHSHQGYFPMQPVYHPANQHGSALYTAAYTRDALIANTHNSGSAYSSQSHSHSQPPSHHRSYTPTSSRSGKSTRSIWMCTIFTIMDLIAPVRKFPLILGRWGLGDGRGWSGGRSVHTYILSKQPLSISKCMLSSWQR